MPRGHVSGKNRLAKLFLSDELAAMASFATVANHEDEPAFCSSRRLEIPHSDGACGTSLQSRSRARPPTPIQQLLGIREEMLACRGELFFAYFLGQRSDLPDVGRLPPRP